MKYYVLVIYCQRKYYEEILNIGDKLLYLNNTVKV